MTFLAFLRGINVGGNALIKMADLREALAAAGFADVRTYIQSGNLAFTAPAASSQSTLAKQIMAVIQQRFNLDVAAAVFSVKEWRQVVQAAPDWWGQDKTWKHNLLIVTEPVDTADVLQAIGALKPELEMVLPGKRVLYQSLSFTYFGRTTSGKLATNPVYHKMTVRNYNTATKMLAFAEA
jgi:uncharacterized protein (DUF1697 family)